MSKTDQFSALEALHSTHLIADMFARHVEEHPFVQAYPALAQKAKAISDGMGALYQAIGSLPIDPEG